MLSAMRSSAKYIWLLIVIAFVGGFLVYESSGLFGRAPITPSTAVATVNGDEILYMTWQQAIQQLEQQQTQASGRSLSLDEEQRISDQAFDQLVDETLLNQEIKRRGITITDQDIEDAARYNPPPQIMQSPDLQTNGQFDIEKYQRFLASPMAKQSGTLYQLEMYYRSELPKEILNEQLAAGVFPSDAQLWSAYRDSHDTAQVTYAVFRPSETPDPSIKISDDQIRAYYDAHKKDLARAGHAMISYTVIPRIITAADSAAVLAHAEDLRNRILKGEKFEDVAKAESADSASAVNGGDLGKGVKGRFVPAFEAAAAKLAPGQISEPVLTQFGYHLIRVDSRNGDTVAMHHILLRITQSDSAATRVDRKADSLSKIAANADKPQHFDSAVKVLGLTSYKAGVVEGQPLVVNGQVIPSVSAWAFKGAKPGETSDLYDNDNGYYLARLESITPGGTPSLDAVKEDIRAKLTHDAQIKLLVDPATKFATAAAGSSLEQASKLLNTPIQQSIPFARVTLVPGIGRANEAIGAAFTLPVGAVSAPIQTEDAVYVIRVDRRTEADKAAFDKDKEMYRQQQMRSLQQGRIRDFMANLREAANIKDHRKDLQARERRATD